MLITYRRKGGVVALLLIGVAAVAAAVLAVAVAVTTLVFGIAIAAAVRLAHAVLPMSWRRHTALPSSPWAHETIEATLVSPADGSDERNPLGLDTGKG